MALHQFLLLWVFEFFAGKWPKRLNLFVGRILKPSCGAKTKFQWMKPKFRKKTPITLRNQCFYSPLPPILLTTTFRGGKNLFSKITKEMFVCINENFWIPIFASFELVIFYLNYIFDLLVSFVVCSATQLFVVTNNLAFRLD